MVKISIGDHYITTNKERHVQHFHQISLRCWKIQSTCKVSTVSFIFLQLRSVLFSPRGYYRTHSSDVTHWLLLLCKHTDIQHLQESLEHNQMLNNGFYYRIERKWEHPSIHPASIHPSSNTHQEENHPHKQKQHPGCLFSVACALDCCRVVVRGNVERQAD